MHNPQEFNDQVGYHYTYRFQDMCTSYDGSVAFHVLLVPSRENDIEKDITIYKDFDLESSFSNITLTLNTNVYSINKNCMRGYCPYCNNGMISSTSHRNSTGINIQIPCNICNGKGYRSLQNDCNHYIVTPREFNVTLPSGIFPGYFVRYTGLGNQLQVKDSMNKKMSLVTGDLMVIVQSVTSSDNNNTNLDNNTDMSENRNHFSVDRNRHVILTVPLCADEVLHGFEKKISYVKGKTLSINRINKVTLPDTVVTLAGRGIPSLRLGTNHSYNDSSTNNSNSTHNSYEDMMIVFTLEEEERCIEIETRKSSKQNQLQKTSFKLLSNGSSMPSSSSSCSISPILRYDGMPFIQCSNNNSNNNNIDLATTNTAEICFNNNNKSNSNDTMTAFTANAKMSTTTVFDKLQENIGKMNQKQSERQKEGISRKLIKMLQSSINNNNNNNSNNNNNNNSNNNNS